MSERPKHEKMPHTRQAIVHKFIVGGTKGYLTVGMYEDGRPGELFIDVAKEGSTVSGLLDTVAIAVSFGLQHGVPLEKFTKKFAYMRFEPSGFTGEKLGYAHSIVDYVFRWLDQQFVHSINEVEPAPEATVLAPEPEAPILQIASDAPPCPKCGAITRRSGSCYACMECGTTTGCS